MLRTALALPLALSTLACAAADGGAEARPDAGAPLLALDDVFELAGRLRLRTSTPGWMPGGAQYLAVLDDGGARRIFVVDAASGARRPLVDAAALQSALEKAGLDGPSAKSCSARTDLELGPAKDGALFDEQRDLWYWEFGAERAVRITNDARDELGATLSPDGRLAAFVADWNLHVAPTDGSAPARALTTEGDAQHLQGRLDWVYQEEVYGRGEFGAFWWSPDSRKLAYLALDDSQVPEVTITDHRTTHPSDERWRYPKAGDPNPVATLHVVDVASGVSQAVDLSPWKDDEPLIVRVGWTPDSAQVWFQIQDRVQTWLDLVYADPATGATRRLFRDRTALWIEPCDGPLWIDGGQRFLWRSERDGWAHLYLYERDGGLVGAGDEWAVELDPSAKPVGRVTQGEWEVDSFLRYDEASGSVYFLGDKADVKGAQLYRCTLAGEPPQRLTRGEGTHAISFSPDGRYFLDRFSSTREWPRLSLHRADGALVRELESVDGAPARAKGVAPAEFHEVRTRDGFELEAMLYRPPHFDASKRYPVVCAIYAGPHSPRFGDRAPGAEDLWHARLAQQGYLVWLCDNRSASGKGLVSQAGIRGNLGAQELRDIEDGVDWLVERGWADPERVGLYGVSYGGYETAYALTHSKRFKCGIAGAPVTDWHLYDSIYTERYMGLPKDNEAGYASSSVLRAADELSGRLLLYHGVIDENVHLQNTLQLAQALQEAGKQFDLMLYPGNRHGVSAANPAQRRHLYEMMTRFFRANL